MPKVPQKLTDDAIKVRQLPHYQPSWVAGVPNASGTFTLQRRTLMFGTRPPGAGEARRAILPQASSLSPFGGDGAAHATSRARMWRGFAPERIAAIEPAGSHARSDRRPCASASRSPF